MITDGKEEIKTEVKIIGAIVMLIIDLIVIKGNDQIKISTKIIGTGTIEILIMIIRIEMLINIWEMLVVRPVAIKGEMHTKAETKEVKNLVMKMMIGTINIIKVEIIRIGVTKNKIVEKSK